MATTMHSGADAAGHRPERSLAERAANDDPAAMRQMFQTFLPADDRIRHCCYLGTKGWGSFGRKSFGCLTDRRVARLEFGFFDEVVYQDALIRDVNSVVFYQPSRLTLYLLALLLVVLAIPSFGATLVVLFFLPQLFYRIVKSGAVFAVKEGVSVYMFANRARLQKLKAIMDDVDRARGVA